MGSALNIPFYDPDKVEFVWGLEPSQAMRKKARKNLGRAPFEVRLLDLPGEEIPLDDNSVDSVLLTYTLCTIPDWRNALQQMRRVLKPGGKLIFCEHGLAPDERVRKWQDRVNPVWKKVAGGCHLNRPIPDYIEEGGFTIQTLDSGYLPGPKLRGVTDSIPLPLHQLLLPHPARCPWQLTSPCYRSPPRSVAQTVCGYRRLSGSG